MVGASQLIKACSSVMKTGVYCSDHNVSCVGNALL